MSGSRLLLATAPRYSPRIYRHGLAGRMTQLSVPRILKYWVEDVESVGQLSVREAKSRADM